MKDDTLTHEDRETLRAKIENEEVMTTWQQIKL